MNLMAEQARLSSDRLESRLELETPGKRRAIEALLQEKSRPRRPGGRAGDCR